ncbi:MAG: hypothetical protein ACHQ4H_13120 [Ktedonobacterales bacterium]
MRCPVCGHEIEGQPEHCPNCGLRLALRPERADQGPDVGAGAPPWGAPAGAPSSPAGYAGYAGYGPGYPPAYGQAAPPSVPMGYPPNYPTGYPAGYPTGYPQEAPSTMPPGMPPGAAAPPSMPLGYPAGYPPPYPPGYGPGYGAPSMPSVPYVMGSPFASAPPKRRMSPLLIVLSVICAVLVVTVMGVGALLLAQRGSGGAPVALPAASATATATLAANVLYQNALTTSAAGWPNDQNCFFRADGYHISGFHVCFAPIGDTINVTVSVQMTQTSGSLYTPHGIVFRHNSNPDRYEFDIDANGDWVFFKCLAAQNKCSEVVDWRSNSAILKGLNAINTLQVQAQGTHFSFSVNGELVGTADDTALSSGAVALVGNDNSEVIFTNITITQPG